MTILDDVFNRVKVLWQMSGEWSTPRAQQAMERYRRHERAWQAYYGKLPKPLKVKPGNPDDNVQVNYARLLVDASVSSLFGDELSISLGEGYDEAQEYLNEWVAASELLQVLADSGVNGGVCGTAYLRLFPPDADSGMYPRVITVSPTLVDVTTDPMDYQKVISVAITYPTTVQQQNTPNASQGLVRLLVERGDGAGWLMHYQSSSFSGFVTQRTEVWPHSYPPIFYCKNLPAPNEFLGLADLESDVIDLLQAVNVVRSNTNRIIRFHAHPKTIGIGFSADQLLAGIDQMVTVNTPDAKIYNLEMQSDLRSSREFARDMETALHAVTRTPEAVTGKLDGLGAVSGVALKILWRPMVEKTESKRRLYGNMIVRLTRAVLDMAGYPDAALNANVTIVWPETVPSDPLTERQVAQIDHELGASKHTLLERFGYDADTELERSATESANVGAGLLAAFDRGDGVTDA